MVRGKAANTPAPSSKLKKPTGRPSSYSDEIADEICEAIAIGGALYKLCDEREHWPSEATVYRWLDAYPSFREKYGRARERQGDRHAHLGLDAALNAKDASLGRLRWDAHRWHASKLAPKKYGDKIVQEHTGANGGPIQSQHSFDASKLSDEQLAALTPVLVALAGGPEGDAGTSASRTAEAGGDEASQ